MELAAPPQFAVLGAIGGRASFSSENLEDPDRAPSFAKEGMVLRGLSTLLSKLHGVSFLLQICHVVESRAKCPFSAVTHSRPYYIMASTPEWHSFQAACGPL